MLRPDRSIERVYLHRAPVDMRKQMDGLSILAKEVMDLDPLSGALFGFINARRNKLKLLVWERNGFIVAADHASTPSGQSQGRSRLIAFGVSWETLGMSTFATT